jgi:hypothetical protein
MALVGLETQAGVTIQDLRRVFQAQAWLKNNLYIYPAPTGVGHVCVREAACKPAQDCVSLVINLPSRLRVIGPSSQSLMCNLHDTQRF